MHVIIPIRLLVFYMLTCDLQQFYPIIPFKYRISNCIQEENFVRNFLNEVIFSYATTIFHFVELKKKVLIKQIFISLLAAKFPPSRNCFIGTAEPKSII